MGQRVVVAFACCILLLVAASPASAVTKPVQGLPFEMSWTPVPIQNILDTEDTGWFDEDSGTAVTAIMSGGAPVGAAMYPVSPLDGGRAAYFGGMFKITSIEDGATYNPISYGREATGVFYGLQFTGIAAVSGGTVNAPAAGLYNLSFTDLAANDALFDLTLDATDSWFEIWVDDLNAAGGADTSNPYPTGIPDLQGLGAGDPINFQTGLPDDGLGGGSNADWASALDSIYGEELLAGKFADDITLRLTFSEVAGTLSLTVDSGSTKLGLTSLQGALEPYVDWYDANAGLDAWVSGVFGKAPHSLGSMPIVAKPVNWVGDGGAAYASPSAATVGAEFEDDIELHILLSVPEPTAVAFMAPSLFGFIGCAVVRFRRRKRS